MSALDLDSPQLGEYAWHVFTADASITTVSVEHRDRIAALVAHHLPDFNWRRARILEAGAYRHYTAYLLAAQLGCEAAVTDISAASLRAGAAAATEAGLKTKVTMVAADFHDLPFTDGYFDVVFIASAVHHTRRPEVVLRELLRVLKPGGLLVLENEPCARVCCFHAFVANRAESFTPFETALHADGLLPTLSSPYWGARGEELFGMVENDRIPLRLYLETFAAGATVVERRLDTAPLVGALEQRLLELRGDRESLHAPVVEVLRSAVARMRALYTDTERLLGYRIPNESEIFEIAGRVAAMLACRPPADPDNAWLTELFGAAATFIVRKNGHSLSGAPLLFRRRMAFAADGLVQERSDADSVAARLGAPQLPEINGSDSADTVAALAQCFPPPAWHREKEHNGAYSLINLEPRCATQIPPSGVRRVLLIRYYSVVTTGPYRIRIWADGRLLDDQLAVLQESRLVRAWVPPNTAEIAVETCNLDGNPVAMPWHVRIGVFQLFAAG